MRLTVDEVSLHYEVHGTGAPILFVHGFPLSGDLWSGVTTTLGTAHRLIVPDLRGHGRSAASETVTMARFADDLNALLDAIEEADPVVVVGMSMGGYIAFEFLRRYPQRVRGLVLANTRAQADDDAGRCARHESATAVLRDGSLAVAEKMMPLLFGSQASPRLRERWRGIMAATDPVGAAAALLAMAERPESFSTLAVADCPVLIVAGEEDALTPPADARSMRDAAPDARLEMIHGAGHMSPVEQPVAFAEALRRFLAGLPD